MGTGLVSTIQHRRWGNGLGLGKQAARSLRRFVVARSLAACLPALLEGWSSLKLMVSTNGVGLSPAPSIIEGRPWTIMQESTCHWNARAFALSMRAGRSFGRARF